MGLWFKITSLQGLTGAWERVKENDCAPGVDGVTVDDFERNRDEYISELQKELTCFNYKPRPIKAVTIEKGEKEREIGILCLRDKVVQQSVNYALSKIYEPKFSSSSYAYRPGKSAKMAGEKISGELSNNYNWVLESDIKDFFNNIVHKKLLEILSLHIYEEQVLNIVNISIKAPVMKNGETLANEIGICQGSPLSPLLSNIYLDSFDRIMRGEDRFYIRYSDDFIILAKEEAQLKDIFERAKEYLKELGLQLKEEKTLIHRISEGFTFLGYSYKNNSSGVSEKSIDSLKNRLEEAWNRDSGNAIEERINKLGEILRGWEQYFTLKDNKPVNIYAYAVSLNEAVRQCNYKRIEELKACRNDYSTVDKQILAYLAGKWSLLSEKELALREYETGMDIINEIAVENRSNKIEGSLDNLLDAWRKVYDFPDSLEAYEELIQEYTDLECYMEASILFEKKNKIFKSYDESEVNDSNKLKLVKEDSTRNEINSINFTEDDISLFQRLFIGREDIYAKEAINESNRRYFQEIDRPIGISELKEHFEGKCTLATYVHRNNDTVKYLVVDIDVSKRLILQYEGDNQKLNEAVKNTHQVALKVKREAEKYGLSCYIEDSGYRGRHCWIFFDKWIQGWEAVNLGKILLGNISNNSSEIILELFPSLNKIRKGTSGQLVKLPLGIHRKGGRRCLFIDDDNNAYSDQATFLRSIKTNDYGQIKKILSSNSIPSPANGNLEGAAFKNRDIHELQVEDDKVEAVLKGCKLICYLCFKAKDTSYLTHFERLTLLYVLGHLGEGGKKFLHKIMEYTLNYNYSTTEKFILKLPGKPISCVKLRDQYKQITANINCNCYFQLAKGCYPSPVLHAINEAEQGEVTLPLSIHTDSENEKELQGKLNIYKHAEELAVKLIELKKQKRGVEKGIHICEEQLSQIFDSLKVDNLNIDMGMLVRKKNGEEQQWAIEI